MDRHRRLRVAPGGTYSSSYSADGVPCNLQQLQTQLRRLRLDPDGSNVVMQGDVTRIVSMSARDRRGIIDELAGVALFDSRIEQTRRKLDDVQEREERCRIVEGELETSRTRLERDCQRARLYQDLRQKVQLGRQQEQVLQVEQNRAQLQQLAQQQEQLGARRESEQQALIQGQEQLKGAAAELATLQDAVKSLGEDQLIAVQGQLAELEAAGRELQRRAERHQQQASNLQQQRHQQQQQRADLQQQIQLLQSTDDSQLRQQADEACRALKQPLSSPAAAWRKWLAARAAGWRSSRSAVAAVRNCRPCSSPQQAEAVQLDERLRQEQERQQELQAELAREQQGSGSAAEQLKELQVAQQELLQLIAKHKQRVQELAEALSLQQRTRIRLEQEQQQLERDIARHDSRRETLQESRGTGALRLLLEAGLDGIHGPVAQLGEVEERHRLALEVAAGARLAQVVVDDDRIAARAIELLKSRRAGRLTFLPLNKIRGPGGGAALQRGGSPSGGGCLGRAVELLHFEPICRDVFGHVFGDTLVYSDLQSARRELGRSRIVTLEGELLERSGAMTGAACSSATAASVGRANMVMRPSPCAAACWSWAKPWWPAAAVKLN